MMDPAEFRQRLNLGSATIEPYQAEQLLNQVSDLFEERCDCYFKYRSGQTMLWEPNIRDTYLWFYGVPVINDSTFALTEWDDVDGIANTCAVQTTDYLINWTTGELRRTRPYRWNQYVQATYDCGLMPAQIPETVKQALVLQARFMQSRFASNKLDVKSQSTKGGSSSYLEGMYHPFFEEIVRLNKRVVHGISG